nr:unnamed protein product [Spirometra erinaceieuropaei]
MARPAVKFTQLFINNEYVNSSSGKTFETIDPSTEGVICHVQEGDAADIDKAVKAAKKAVALNSPWRTMNASERGRLLLVLANLIEENGEYIAALEEAGWQASLAFPTASKENVKLLELLTESRAKIQEVSGEGNVYREKNRKLRDHIELVKTERRQAEELRVELDKEIENQRHLIKLAEQENWRTGSDNRKLLQQKKKIVDRLGSLEVR